MLRGWAWAWLAGCGSARVLDVRDFGAKHSKVAGSKEDLAGNAAALSQAFVAAANGDTVLVPQDLAGPLWSTGVPYVRGWHNVTLHIEGDLRAAGQIDDWPLECPNCDYGALIGIFDSSFVTVTGGGHVDGGGPPWWDRMFIGHLPHSRPKLIKINNSTDVLVHHLSLTNSPSFHLEIYDTLRAEIHHVNVTVDRKFPIWDPKLQPVDLNTDGFDVSGRDIWIHHCYITNDDDSIAVKPCRSGGCFHADCTENVLIEDCEFTGFGASIGSVPPSVPMAGHEFGNCVRNVTFRRIKMPGTGKGVYVKSNPGCREDGSANALIADILYEDVDIDRPVWWAIWIGPQQMHMPGEPIGDECPLTYPLNRPCGTQACVTFRNITLRRVTITDPLLSPGVILGNASNPMDIRFESVVVKYTNPLTGRFPYGRQYQCHDTSMKVDASSSPVPNCIPGGSGDDLVVEDLVI